MITLDTSAIFALLNRADPDHGAVKAVVLGERGPFLVPAGIMAEIGYLVEERLGTRVLSAFLDDVLAGNFMLVCNEESLSRVRDLVNRYDDLPLGFSDAAVIACAEIHGGRVLTLDVRDFSVVAKEGLIQIVPETADAPKPRTPAKRPRVVK